jgi:hypothetical protein
LSKRHRQKQTAVPKPLVKREILFPFGPTTIERQEALSTLYAELRQPISSTRAEITVSLDGQQTKITLWCDTAQENFLESFLRQAPGTKVISDEDPVDAMAQLIRQYHHHLWNDMDFPDAEMHLSALVTGIGYRQVMLDAPTFRPQTELWKLGDEWYQAIERTGLFAAELPCQKMVVYSFLYGYLGGQGAWEEATRSANGQLKAQILVLEERGQVFTVIHAHMDHMKKQLLKLGYRNAIGMYADPGEEERRIGVDANADLEMVEVSGERRVDSRIIARGIKVQHDNLMQTVRKCQTGLEKYGVILFETGKPPKGSRGGRPEQYALLNKEQFGYLMMFVRVTDRVRAYREDVYDKFLEYERLTSKPPCPIHMVTDAMRDRVLVNIHLVPDDGFLLSVATFKHFYNLEAILNAALDEKAVPEISVGKLFPKYVLEKLGRCPRRRLLVELPSGKQGEVWVYPIELLGMFDRWLWDVYVPEHFPAYAHYRAKRVGRPAPRLLLPTKPTLQLPLWDGGSNQAV